MFPRLSKAAIAAILMLAALPAVAGDNNGYRHHGFGGRPGISFQGRPNLYPRPAGFFSPREGYRHRGYGRPLREIYSPQPRIVSNTILVPQAGGASYSNGYYGGSGYAYQVNGGTYVGADGYAPYPSRRTENLAPKAKVIDVAVADDPCSYEANVCVIRP